MEAKKIAEYFLSLSDPEIGELISNLKLQKLLYYAQGFNLALNNEKLFDEEIYAWDYGPVVIEVYNEYKKYGAGTIPPPEKMDYNVINDGQRELLNDVYKVYGQFSAWKLMNMTHNETPWKTTEKGQKIDREKLQSYFKTLING